VKQMSNSDCGMIKPVKINSTGYFFYLKRE